MLLSISHAPSSHRIRCEISRTSLSSPSIFPVSSVRLKNPKPYAPHNQSSNLDDAGKSAIQRISKKLRRLGYHPEDPAAASGRTPPTGPGGEISITTVYEIPKYRRSDTIDPSWSTPEHPVPVPGSSDTITRFGKQWKRERKNSLLTGNEVRPTVTKVILPLKEIARLRTLGISLKMRLRVGKAGITERTVNRIHDRWIRSEVVKIWCEDLCRMEMKRTHEILERKTGGLVVWRSANIIILYRGKNYCHSYFHPEEKRLKLVEGFSKLSSYHVADKEQGSSSSSAIVACTSTESNYFRVCLPFVTEVVTSNNLCLQLTGKTCLAKETDRLLDGLGPRYIDWWGYDPLPVDGDLLPAIVPLFCKPYRLLPFGLKPHLTDQETTILRRLSRHLPCHFVLGKNRNLQGLSASIIKLWEKCEVAKIAIKRGVQNTNSKLMAEELKKHTGGTLLSRDKYFIVFYRGKDFLPIAVSAAIKERGNWNSIGMKPANDETLPLSLKHSSWVKFSNSSEAENKVTFEGKRSLMYLNNVKLRKAEAKLIQVNQKLEKSEKRLAELKTLTECIYAESDREGISEEERYMLRRVGIRMKPFLLVGRRGVFDGTIENMHLHWKYRELVKIIFDDWYFKNVESSARTLEAESGGIIIAIERVSEGYAVVMYRGKNYRCPVNLRPRTLLNKLEAGKCALESQRSKSLKLQALHISKTIGQLKCKVNNDFKINNMLISNGLTGPISSSKIIGNIKPLIVGDDNRCEAEVETNLSLESEFNRENIESMAVLEHQYEIHEHKILEPCQATIKNTSMYGIEGKSFDLEHNKSSKPSTCNYSRASKELSINLSCGGAQNSLGISPFSESCLKQKVDVGSFIGYAPLSKQARLLLRKRAHRMRCLPGLAIGSNNIFNDVVKKLVSHFKKHPLAIVDIKGRAKGTSVHEIVFKLEKTTGSVLVSRDPNKLILYRGSGEGGIMKNL